MHTGGRVGVRIKVDPPFYIFTKLVTKNAIKTPKGVPSFQNFYNPHLPSLPKTGKPSWTLPQDFQNRMHLCF
jgi:hypothetical protein